MLPIRCILHPTDFKAQSEHAFRLAYSLARDHGARLIVLHVVADQPAKEVVWDLLNPAEDYSHMLEQKLRKLTPPDSDVAVEYRLERGSAAKRILRVGEESQCELIVMGTHAHMGLHRFAFGSVAEEVRRKASCPVLTIKLPYVNGQPYWEPAELIGA